MAKRRISQFALGVTLIAAVVLTLPGFLFDFGTEAQPGLILVNGRIEGTEVALGTMLPGKVVTVNVIEGQEVKKGDLLAKIDTKELDAALERAQANVRYAKLELDNAKQQVSRTGQELKRAQVALELCKKQTALTVEQSKAAVEEAQAGVEHAKALQHKAKLEYDKAKDIAGGGAATDLEVIFADDALKAHNAAVKIAESRLQQALQKHKLAIAAQAEVQIKNHEVAGLQIALQQTNLAVGQAEAQLDGADASVKIIESQLTNAQVIAPCNGVVITRVLEPGEVAMIGAPVIVIMDFDKLYLKGFLPNRIVGKVKLNDLARVHLDAMPDKHFEGRVQKIHQQAEFTPKNVDTPQQRVKLVFGIEIHVDNLQRAIKAGMPGDCVIRIDPSVSWKTPRELR